MNALADEPGDADQRDADKQRNHRSDPETGIFVGSIALSDKQGTEAEIAYLHGDQDHGHCHGHQTVRIGPEQTRQQRNSGELQRHPRQADKAEQRCAAEGEAASLGHWLHA